MFYETSNLIGGQTSSKYIPIQNIEFYLYEYHD